MISSFSKYFSDLFLILPCTYQRYPKRFVLNILKPAFKGLVSIIKHDDYAMTWYDYDDSYSPFAARNDNVSDYFFPHIIMLGKENHSLKKPKFNIF